MTPQAPWPAPPSRPDPSAIRRRRWLLAAVVGWSVLLLVVTYVSVRRDAPTVREQRDIGQAAPIVDRALGEIVAAAGPDAVVELGERRLRTGCRLTVLRKGATLDATVTVRAPEAEASTVLDRIAAGLPAGYRAGVRHRPDGTGEALRADAGEFVAVDGELVEPGVVVLEVYTGCRPVAAEPADRPVPSPHADADPVRVLAALGATDLDPVDMVEVDCPGQGSVRTFRSAGRGVPAGPPSAALPRPAGTVVVTDTPEVYAYRTGPVSVVIENGDGRIRASTTTGCR